MNVFTPDEIQLVQEQIDDWEAILKCMKYDFRQAVKLIESKQERCGLCPRYEHRVPVIDRRGRASSMLSCRRCPIVRITRRTCAHWRVELMLREDWYLNKKAAPVVTLLILCRLNLVLSHMAARSAESPRARACNV